MHNNSKYPEPPNIKSKHFMPPNPKILYTEKIEKALLSLKPDEYFIIEKNVKEENRESFVEIVKWMIAHRIFARYKKVPEFSNDFSKVRMIAFEEETKQI